LLISELAALSGFTAATLRYYEQLGLLAAYRTPSGSRLYDQAALTRLRFIDGVKQLGLPWRTANSSGSGTWAGTRTSRTARRAYQGALGAGSGTHRGVDPIRCKLVTAQVDMEGQAPEGPCGEECGCVPARHGGTRVAQPVEFKRAPLDPIAGTRLMDSAVVEQPMPQTPVTCTRFDRRPSRASWPVERVGEVSPRLGAGRGWVSAAVPG
jgi:hypothetical protein